MAVVILVSGVLEYRILVASRAVDARYTSNGPDLRDTESSVSESRLENTKVQIGDSPVFLDRQVMGASTDLKIRDSPVCWRCQRSLGRLVRI